MDTEERHDLKENDLAEILRNFGDWFNQHGTKVLLIVIIVAAAFTGYNFYSTSVQQQYDNAWMDLSSAVTPEDYLQVARAYDEPTVQTLAHLRGGDLFRRRAIGRYESPGAGDQAENGSEVGANGADNAGDTNGVDANGEAPSPEADLEQAAAMYRRVLEPNGQLAPAIYRANALIGLGAVAESRRAWDEARDHYQQAIDVAGDALPQLRRQAERRLELVDELRRPIIFAPEAEADDTPTGSAPGVPDMQTLEELGVDLPAPGESQAPQAPAPTAPSDDAQDAQDGPTSEGE